MTDRRPLTAAVRRRAWGELGVRPWTFMAVATALAGVVIAYGRWADWAYEKRVIERGTPVSAEVVMIGLEDRQGRRDEALNVMLRYTPPGSSSPLESRQILPRKGDEVIKQKDVLRVRIDPARPEFWTDRTEVPPIGLTMITPLICGGVALACLMLAWGRRAGVLRAYRAAGPRRATVQSVRQSPLAPFSKLVGVTLDDGEDRRTRDCYWPNKAGAIHPQQSIDVLASGRRTFAAAAYDAPSSGTAGRGLG